MRKIPFNGTTITVMPGERGVPTKEEKPDSEVLGDMRVILTIKDLADNSIVAADRFGYTYKGELYASLCCPLTNFQRYMVRFHKTLLAGEGNAAAVGV